MFERRRALVAGVVTVMLATAGAAHAKTYRVSGQQVVDDPAAGTAHMTGGLVGQWAATSAKETAKTPLIRAKGGERFTGCIDRARDGSCDGDPTGTLRFTFQFWGQPGDAADQVVWGACYHPIVSGTGDLKGARGVLVMADTPTTAGQTRTDYLGNVTLGAVGAASSARAAMVGCAPHGPAR
jgi:hypothetical protein